MRLVCGTIGVRLRTPLATAVPNPAGGAEAERTDQKNEAESEERASEVMSITTDPEESPERAAERRQLLEKVEAALAKLVENRRLAVEFYLQGMTSLEIADLMDWTEAKARNLIYRGLEDLRKYLRDAGVEYG